MPVQITIRDVPKAIRNQLAVRAARQHQSMQQFLRAALVRLASRPSVTEWLRRVRESKAAARPRVHPSSILRARRMDRM